MLISASSFCYAQKKSDSVRDHIKFGKPEYVYNEDHDIEAITIGYLLPNGKTGMLKAELMFPQSEESFTGGEIHHEDINFDGIPDLQVSLGVINGYGSFVYEGYIWNSKKQVFTIVENYCEIINAEPVPEEKCIHGANRVDNDITFTKWEWKNGRLVKVTEETVDVNDLFKDIEPSEPADAIDDDIPLMRPLTDEEKMQNQAIAGEWKWVEGESELNVELTLECDDGYLSVGECMIYGSTATFDVGCTYIKGVLMISDNLVIVDDMPSLEMELRLNPRGDLVGKYKCTVGETTDKGKVVLRHAE